ncbi:MAG: HesA/MoeB/ThiF family protein [Candidatus Bathyarchaeia archaeon]
MFETPISFEEFYNRQILLKELGREGQEKLSHSKVAVVGLGGLGSVASLYLALAGVGYLRLIDQDIVEPKNLHRQILYTLKDVKYPKAEVAAKKLSEFNPLIQVEAIPENLNGDNAEELLSGVDCVVDGLDNMATRYIVNRTCVKFRIPYVFGAAIGLEGNLSVFAHPETPCLECIMPNINDAALPTCDIRGVLNTTPGIIGIMEALEAIKVLAGIGAPLKGKLMICDFGDMYITTIDVAKSPNCPACQHEKPERGNFKHKLVWLCGRNTVNINPEKPINLNLDNLRQKIERNFKIQLKSQAAVVFTYKNYEVTIFRNGRMLIKDISSVEEALRIHQEISQKLGIKLY